MPPPPRPWAEAWAAALYGPDGFYRRELPAAHFRTSVSASPLFAAALRRLADRVDEALGRPDRFDVVDIGAADGSLLSALGAGAPARWRLHPLEVDDPVPALTGVLLANEWLDTVPCTVVEQAEGGPREVLEDWSLGGPVSGADLEWLAREWPLTRRGQRAEVGRTRDRAWAAAVGRLQRGVAVAVDYCHHRSARPDAGTLAGYRHGRWIPPVADGSCDITAHVALDACAAAAEADDTLLTTQRAALRDLGVSAARPRYDAAPAGYLAALSAAGEAAELLDPAALGAFGWLVQSKGCPLPVRH